MGIYLQHENLEAVSFDHIEYAPFLGEIARPSAFPLALERMVSVARDQPERSWPRCLNDFLPCFVLLDDLFGCPLELPLARPALENFPHYE
jgi:hypothetical protein